MEKENPKEDQENLESEYIGNIWGWKFSFISLGIIVVMLMLMLFRYNINKNHPPLLDQETITIDNDSSQLKSQSID